MVSAKYLSDYVIRIAFNDGNDRIVDFKKILIKITTSYCKEYFDENEFSNFSLRNGNLNWNDYDVIFPIDLVPL
ncbi:MAG: DUF2442 domain-containing protein [Saprospirales bacterium]|nr:MAG: DUF2442 domain-containing protein [Saprospirales bacterium]